MASPEDLSAALFSLSLLPTCLPGGLHLDTNPSNTGLGTGHELLPWEEGRGPRGTGSLNLPWSGTSVAAMRTGESRGQAEHCALHTRTTVPPLGGPACLTRKRHGALCGTLESRCRHVCQSPPSPSGEGVPGATVGVVAHPLSSTSHPPSSPPAAYAPGCLARSRSSLVPPQLAPAHLPSLNGAALSWHASGPCMSRRSTDKPALSQGAGDSTQICRVTLTLVPGWPWLLGAGTAFPVLSLLAPVVLSLLLQILAPASRVPASPEGVFKCHSLG
ncbi:hypothetical protein MC885_010969 [Smutsia gigantea]|nr:hypothetical protein MC885_010969 [Smutsia gigantea]